MRDAACAPAARRLLLALLLALAPALGLALPVLLRATAASADSAREAPRSVPPASVLVVVLDAARADHFGIYGYARDTTPRIDAFARGAVRYETVISEAPFTFLATSSLFTGGSPAVTGLVGRRGGRVPPALELVAETARRHGFATLAYSENPFVTRYFGLHQGFEVFEEAFPVALHARGEELPSDFDSGARLAALVERLPPKGERPFFAYVHLLRPHTPYAPPPPYAGRFGSDPARRSLGGSEAVKALDRAGPPFDPDRLDQLVALYDENLAYADALFGRLLDGLEARGRDADTVVILTSDHGEAFGEHGRLLHSTQLHDPMLRIPLLIRAPSTPPAVVPHPVQLADLGRALRAHFTKDPSDDRPWSDLAGTRPADAPLFSWTNARSHLVSARTPERKLILDARSGEVVAYYDLVADPEERRPIPLDDAGRALRPLLEARIAEWAGRAPGPRIEPAERLDPRKRRQLEALGYLEPAEAEPVRPSSEEVTGARSPGPERP